MFHLHKKPISFFAFRNNLLSASLTEAVVPSSDRWGRVRLRYDSITFRSSGDRVPSDTLVSMAASQSWSEKPGAPGISLSDGCRSLATSSTPVSSGVRSSESLVGSLLLEMNRPKLYPVQKMIFEGSILMSLYLYSFLSSDSSFPLAYNVTIPSYFFE